jgi:hypothetical protein
MSLTDSESKRTHSVIQGASAMTYGRRHDYLSVASSNRRRVSQDVLSPDPEEAVVDDDHVAPGIAWIG